MVRETTTTAARGFFLLDEWKHSIYKGRRWGHVYQAIMLLIAVGIAVKIASNTLKSIKKAVDDLTHHQR